MTPLGFIMDATMRKITYGTCVTIATTFNLHDLF